MKKGVVTIKIGEGVLLEDFSALSNEYIQLYGFFYSLRILGENPGVKLEHEQLPWTGGSSVVNFFNALTKYVHPTNRVAIKKIEYSPSSVIKLSAIKDVSKDVAVLIKHIVEAVPDAATTYHLIQLHYQKSKLTKLKMSQLEQRQLRDKIVFVEESLNKLQKIFGFTAGQMASMLRMAQDDELVQLKMMMAIYRRALPLVDLKNAGKIYL